MNESDSAPSRKLPRAIRVFVSSTFRDMQLERDELAKRIFPALRRVCEERCVTWGEVDLRWGVSSEEAAEGRVLPVCLAEIDRCRPYFIGLLGERYGFVPAEIPEELIAVEPWLAEHRDSSITELEILHAVLRDPIMSARAFFYFRDPGYVAAAPADMRAQYCEEPTEEEINEFGTAEAERRAAARRQKITALKDLIRERYRTGSLAYAPREGYSDPRVLGQLVLADFTNLIDEIFPARAGVDPLDREAAEHEAFAASRCELYVPRERDLSALDAHVEGDGPPLVVVGEAGVGKTALLANWARRQSKRVSETLLLQHYIGAIPSSTNSRGMVRRLMGEFDRRFGLGIEIPQTPAEMRLAFATVLHEVAAKGRVVLVIDALNQLEDSEQTSYLAWLPPTIPGNVRLIVSTYPGPALEELRRRGWPTLEITPLDEAEMRQLIKLYVTEKHGGQLTAQQIDCIAGAPQTTNPLYLRTVLEELRVFGAHARLDERIAHYLEAPTVPELYARVLARWEEDYERERPGLVRDAMSLLWAARTGLSETELLGLLGTGQEALPHACWSPLHLAAWESLMSRSGLLCFFHDALRQGVTARYLRTREAQCSAHATLARYFDATSRGVRRADELPWQQANAEEWDALTATLSDLDLLRDIVVDDNDLDLDGWTNERQYQWAALWRELAGRVDPVSVYEESLRAFLWKKGHSHETRVVSTIVGSLLETLGEFPGAARAFRISLDIAYSLCGPSSPTFVAGLDALAGKYKQQGDLESAVVLYQQAVDALENATEPQPKMLAAVVNNLAMARFACGKLGEARLLAERSVDIRREYLGVNHPDYAMSLDNLAAICSALGQRQQALELHKTALETLLVARGSHSFDVATVHANMGMAYLHTGQRELSEQEFETAIRIYRDLLGKDAPVLGVVVHNLATLYQRCGANQKARSYYEEALRIERAAHGERHATIARNLLGLAAVSLAERRFDEARSLLARASRIAAATMSERQPERLMIDQWIEALGREAQ
ncbi:MAG TPA: tetratricopeptide repeat protein [Terriglobales bacterium]|nr:tetratricopeptide repeat protein [Terriglobales bacterium]